MRYIFFSIILVIFIGCGGNSFDTDFREYLYKLFTTEYFWANKVDKDVDYSKFKTPNEMVKALRYKPIDRWSMVITKEENDNFLNQKSTGFGFAYMPYEDNETQIVTFVRIGSPANRAKLKRGDIIESINNKKATLLNIKRASINKGVTSIFRVYRASIDKYIDINITSSEYNFKVTKASIVKTIDNQRVGYMRFDSFTATATQEIDSAFDYFKDKNIRKLVIDLRYNGGGSIVTASILLDKLIRDQDDNIQFKLSWNDDFQKNNQVAKFETDENSLDLDTIIFLTTKITASASEAVINALRPYMGENIVIVGSKTYGKPVGMTGKSDRFYIYYLVNFVIKNADEFYDYFDGLDVTDGCNALDDLTHQLGDPNEEMLKKALFYIDNKHC
jgi:C-terminal peptidase prc